MDLYELISDADQILLYNTTNEHSSPITGQQILEDLMEQDVTLLQRCVYGCAEHQQNLQQREQPQAAGSKPNGDAAGPEKKSGSNEEPKSNSEAEGAQRAPTQQNNDNEAGPGNVITVTNIVVCKVSRPDRNQDGQ